VGHGRGELDVSHALAAHVGPGHLDAAALADDALEADPLVLAAVALPVPGGAEDLLTEEAVALGLERANSSRWVPRSKLRTTKGKGMLPALTQDGSQDINKNVRSTHKRDNFCFITVSLSNYNLRFTSTCS
jgi:hypothetical protein